MKSRLARVLDVLWCWRIARNWSVAVFFTAIGLVVFWHVWQDSRRPEHRLAACVDTLVCTWSSVAFQCLCACATESGVWPAKLDSACKMGDDEGGKPGFPAPTYERRKR